MDGIGRGRLTTRTNAEIMMNVYEKCEATAGAQNGNEIDSIKDAVAIMMTERGKAQRIFDMLMECGWICWGLRLQQDASASERVYHVAPCLFPRL